MYGYNLAWPYIVIIGLMAFTLLEHHRCVRNYRLQIAVLDSCSLLFKHCLVLHTVRQYTSHAIMEISESFLLLLFKVLKKKKGGEGSIVFCFVFFSTRGMITVAFGVGFVH